MTFLLVLVSTVTAFFTALVILRRFLGAIHPAFHLGLAWFLAREFRGFIAAWGYFLDVPIHQVIAISAVTGIVSAAFSLRYAGELKADLSKFYIPSERNYPLIVVALVYLLIQIYYASAPWIHHDEIAVYGFYSKYMAKGLTFSDFLNYWPTTVHVGPRLAETLIAQWMCISSNPLLSKIYRFTNIIFFTSMGFGFFRMLNVSLRWSALGAICIISAPEIAWHMTSLKIDFGVMCFELASIFCLLLVMERTEATATHEQRFRFLVLSVIFSSASVACRQSGINLLLVALAYSGIYLYQNRNKQLGLPYCKYAGIIAACLFLASSSYLFSILKFGNPFYPFKDPSGIFASGSFIHHLSDYKGYYNLSGLPGWLSIIYMPMHLSLGLELRNWFSWIPHASHQGVSMEWLNLSMLWIYPMPFLAIRSDRMRKYLLLFLPLYVLWFMGVHYSRVFLAEATIPVLACILYAATEKESKVQFVARALIFCELLIGIWVGYRGSSKVDAGFANFFSEDARFESVHKHLAAKRPDSTRFLTMEEFNEINLKMSSLRFPSVVVVSDIGRTMHAALNNGFYFDPESMPVYVKQGSDVCLVANTKNPLYPAEYKKYKMLYPAADKELFTTKDGIWTVRCSEGGVIR